MGLLDDLQGVLTKGVGGLGDSLSKMSGASSARGGASSGTSPLSIGGLDLSGLLGPAALGGLLGALATSKGARGITTGALLAGGGTYLWNKYKDLLIGAYGGSASEDSASPQAQSLTAAPVSDRARRLVRAMVFAAKSDGHIDETERRVLGEKIRELQLGAEADTLVQQALDEPLDPNSIAAGVNTPEEAMEVYLVSCATIDINHFMERGYLDALATALKIPDAMKQEIESGLSAAKAG